MNEVGSLLFLYTETPLHAGSGIALGAVDLPIQRERMTGLPMVQGSGIKGSLRQMFRESPDAKDKEDLILKLFGPEPPEPSEREGGEGGEEEQQEAKEREEFAGALSVQDARLLLMPVRTVWGGFAWATSPLLLDRLARDLAAVKQAPLPLNERALQEIRDIGTEQALVSPKSAVAGDGRLIVEDLDYTARSSDSVDMVARWVGENAIPAGAEYKAFKDRLPRQLVILSDAELKFWSEHGTEVVSRIRIDEETGTVKKGALWSEESLPAESVLWSLAFFSGAKRKVDIREEAGTLASSFSKHLGHRRIRLGGDRTVGRGLVSVRLLSAATKGGA